MKKKNFWPQVGQEKVVAYWQKVLRKGKIAPVYLLSGPAYTGKKDLALSFAQALVCPEGKKGYACGKCSFCQMFFQGNYPDFWEIKREEGKKEISVQQIREAKEKVSKSSLEGGYKILFFPEAQYLNLAAFNALLKVLEEPPEKTVFLLLTTSLAEIPLTIRSRAQIMHFNPLSAARLEKILAVCQEKGNELKEKVALAQGRPLLAYRYQNNPHFFQEEKKIFYSFLELFSQPLSQKFVFVEKSFSSAKSFLEKRALAKQMLARWRIIIRDLLLAKINSSQLISCVFAKDEINKIQEKYTLDNLIQWLDYLNQAEKYLNKNTNPQLVLENLILKF